LKSFEEEPTYAFGGSSIVRGSAAMEALSEETVLISIEQVYHAV
jgi:hypothetical protein